MAHVYSLGLMLGHEGSGELADAALKGLKGELHDEKNGGWYAGVTPEGDIVPNKQCYAHAFVILAASSALTAGRPGAKELLEEALAVYDRHFWNEEEGLACDTWNTEFTVLDDYRGLNANMHTVEAFLAAGDVTGDKKYHIRAGRIIDHVIQWAEDNSWRIPEHFTKEWAADLDCNRDRPDDPFKPYGATPGHGIEWARLITQWALANCGEEKEKLEKYLPQAELIFNTVPAPILTDPLLIKQIRKDAVLFELASGSGCISEEACRQAGLCRIACPGLPGRFSPKASARILCRASTAGPWIGTLKTTTFIIEGNSYVSER